MNWGEISFIQMASLYVLSGCHYHFSVAILKTGKENIYQELLNSGWTARLNQAALSGTMSESAST